MAIRISSAEWKGSLKEGSGTMKVGSGVFKGPFSFASRFESGPGTNPEELIGAAHAGCFSMALSGALSAAGFTPRRISTTAAVHLGAGPAISLIELTTEADVPKVDEAAFQRIAEDAKKNCPVSKALTGVEIRLKATLVK
jgi:osmotically inducible protein OsmC